MGDCWGVRVLYDLSDRLLGLEGGVNIEHLSTCLNVAMEARCGFNTFFFRNRGILLLNEPFSLNFKTILETSLMMTGKLRNKRLVLWNMTQRNAGSIDLRLLEQPCRYESFTSYIGSISSIILIVLLDAFNLLHAQRTLKGILLEAV
jgi:hypothetical protein